MEAKGRGVRPWARLREAKGSARAVDARVACLEACKGGGYCVNIMSLEDLLRGLASKTSNPAARLSLCFACLHYLLACVYACVSACVRIIVDACMCGC